MTGSSRVLYAVLTVATVLVLTMLSLLCLRCRRKKKIIEEQHQIYNPQMFQRGGSLFAVTRSKTVTQPNQITTTTTSETDLSTVTEEQPDYENIINPRIGIADHTYVAPLPASLYGNEENETKTTDDVQTPDVYANILEASTQCEDDDYENTAYLNNIANEEEDINLFLANEAKLELMTVDVSTGENDSISSGSATSIDIQFMV
ncbi:uncharacterized protein LOC142885716 isoform X2 [Nelusetta ayraudi]|uniref:uncharacterized protein LOC142885716 isoform X2 n=1 Tax=Nelusetta ayraudi TaxID=303726 RepID=UPI003F7137BB